MNGILLNENGDLLIVGGKIQIGRVNEQNKGVLLLINKGELKEHPTVGVGAAFYIENSDVETLAREIKTEFAREGIKVNKINISMPCVEIDADYEN